MKKVFFCLFLCLACEGEFGTKTKKFVDKEVPKLSLSMAESGFEKKIYQSFLVEFSKISLELKTLDQYLDRYTTKLPEDIHLLDMNHLQQLRFALLSNESHLLKIKSHLDTIRREFEEFKNICSTMPEGFLKEAIQLEVFNIAVPDRNDSIYISNDIVDTIARNVLGIFSSYSQGKQISIMEKAIFSIPEKVPNEEILRAVFNKRCKEAYTDFIADEEFQAFNNSLKKLSATVGEEINLVHKAFDLLNTRIYQVALDEVYEKYGINEIDQNEALEKLYTEFLREYTSYTNADFSIISKLMSVKDQEKVIRLINEWEELYTQRLKFLASVKGIWPYYAERMSETLKRRSNVGSIIKKIHGVSL